MNANQAQRVSAPPRLIPSFLAGFNSVASHIYLILFPVLLDVVLWFAPRVSVKGFLKPLIGQYTDLLAGTGSADIAAFLTSSQAFWEDALARFNLLSTVRTLPIGIPSLLAGRGVIENPIGQPTILDVSSLVFILGVWGLCVLVGLAGGSLFFGEVARISLEQGGRLSFSRFWKMFTQTLVLTASMYLLILVLAVPIMLVMTIVSLINPALTQLAVIFLSLLLIWFLLPLIFSPHGIYSYDQNVFTAAINSIRLVRYFLPGTGLFLLMAVLISQGMDILWTFPPEQSWMTVVGILGHAFIVTGLIASSFVYYRGGILWMNEKLKRYAANNTMVSAGQK